MPKKNYTLPVYAFPTLEKYYSNLSPFLILCMFVAALLLLLNLSIFMTTASHMRKRLQKPFLWRSMLLTSLYTIVSCAAFISIMLPKSWLICHTIMHLSFTLGAPIFRNLCFKYVGSEETFLNEHHDQRMSISTPPCCCCCKFLPECIPNKLKFNIVRYMVWQMPLVQGSIMLILNVIYYTDPEVYDDVALYFIPFIFTSILSGVWGLNITVRYISSAQMELRLLRKLFSLQLVLLLCKLQYLILDNQLDNFTLGEVFPMNHTITKQTIINMLILTEMVFVSLLAQSAYRVPIQTIENNDDKLDTFL